MNQWYIILTKPLPAAVLKLLDLVRAEATKHNFENKKNFPPSIKPSLIDAANCAMDYQVMNAVFFQYLTSILPYNTFTLRVFYFDVEIDFKNSLSRTTAEFEEINPWFI